MSEEYINEEQILNDFALKIDQTLFAKLQESFLEDPVILYLDDGNVDIATALSSDYFQRSAFGEFDEVEQYLSELCANIGNQALRDMLIDEFDLD